jgi:hypothetical protein
LEQRLESSPRKRSCLGGERSPSLERQWHASKPALKVPPVQHTIFPVSFFLDSDSASQHKISGDRRDPGISVPNEILEILRSVSAIISLCNTYLESTHSWLPILSRKRILQKANEFDSNTDIGLALLLLCMKLVSESPNEAEHPTTTLLYRLTKVFYLSVESSCLISLQTLQACVLIAVYELGHGIYPAAYLSIGHAARLGIMIGLHDKKHAQQLFREAETWSQGEEQRRTWWAIVLLERYTAAPLIDHCLV